MASAGPFRSPPTWANCPPTSRHLLPAPLTATPGGAGPGRCSPPPPSPAGDSQLPPVPARNRSLSPPPAPSPDGHRCPHPPGTELCTRPVAAAGSLPTPHPSPQPPSLPPSRPAPPPPPPPPPPPLRLLRVSPAGKAPGTPPLPPPRGEGRPAPAVRPGLAARPAPTGSPPRRTHAGRPLPDASLTQCGVAWGGVCWGPLRTVPGVRCWFDICFGVVHFGGK